MEDFLQSIKTDHVVILCLIAKNESEKMFFWMNDQNLKKFREGIDHNIMS